jgi:hypothetical protein
MSRVKELDCCKTHKNSRHGVTQTLESYERLFGGSQRFKAIGEV